jgi:RNA polymerase sigma-70 factor (ECF subfamily)
MGTSGMNIITDEKAAFLAKDGHKEAFRELYERHRASVYGLAHRYAGSTQDAEDILQETFIKAFRGIRKFGDSGKTNFAAWIKRICLYRCIEHLRKRQRRRTDQTMSLSEYHAGVATNDVSPERSAEIGLLIDKVQQVLGALSPRQRIIFTMKYLEQREIPDIAETLGCSESAVKTHLGRAVTKLRDHLAPIMEEL